MRFYMILRYHFLRGIPMIFHSLKVLKRAGDGWSTMDLTLFKLIGHINVVSILKTEGLISEENAKNIELYQYLSGKVVIIIFS